MGLGVIVLIGAFSLTSRGSTSATVPPSTAPERAASSPTTDNHSASPDTSVESATTLGVAEKLELARVEWMAASEQFSGDFSISDVELVNDVPTVAAVTELAAPVTIFQFDSANGWRSATTFDVEWGLAEILPAEFRLIDVTDDGSAELFIGHVPYNDYVGVVYQASEQGPWRQIADGDALEVSDTGLLSGHDNTCVPSCADGVMVNYTLTWTGSTFRKQSFDSFGNPIDVVITTKCVGDYFPRSTVPLHRCDKGDVVEQLQRALKWAGYLVSVDGSSPMVDGYYGPGTETSVRLYQLAAGVPVTGVAEGAWYYDLIETYNLATGGG